MNIVILGAGTVGKSIAELLCEKGYSITVVDHNPQKTKLINEQLDVRAITGSASTSSVLFQAGMFSADICLAVTGVDEVNIIAASMSKSMGAHRAIARVYAPVFRDLSTFDYCEHFGIDRLLSLEQLTAMELANHIRDLGSAVVEQFAHGGLEVHEFVINEKSAAAGKRLVDLKMSDHLRIGTINRHGKMWIASADDELQMGDRVLTFCQPDHASDIKDHFKKGHEQRRKIVIGGGGETGFHLAEKLQRHRFSVTILESDPKRCQYLAKHLPQTEVVNCSASQWEVMQEEGVGNADTFVACLGSDENNILAGVEARDLGASQILAVVNRPDYTNVVAKLGIDFAVSAREVMARQILSFLQDGYIIRRQNLGGGDVQLLELEIAENAAATTSTLAEFELDAHFLIVALIRKDIIRIPTASDTLKPDDSIVVLVDGHDANSVIAFFTKG